MTGEEISECVAIVQRLCPVILGVVDARRGIETSALRRYVGAMYSNAETLLQDVEIAAQLSLCMNEARALGAQLVPFGRIRKAAMLEEPTTLPGVSLKQAIIRIALANEARIVAGMTFVSIDDASVVASTMSAAFNEAAEAASDELDAGAYMALIGLGATVSRYINDTARTLPRVVSFRWARPMTVLSMAQRIYQDGARSDEIRAQNKIVHPAFCPLEVRALSK